MLHSTCVAVAVLVQVRFERTGQSTTSSKSFGREDLQVTSNPAEARPTNGAHQPWLFDCLITSYPLYYVLYEYGIDCEVHSERASKEKLESEHRLRRLPPEGEVWVTAGRDNLLAQEGRD